MSTTTTIDSHNTFRFNVGGTKFDQYPGTLLEAMVSGRWNIHESEEIFIERDSERFRYVLDFMRNGGTVHLPFAPHVSREEVLKDLIYFGSDGLNPSAVQASGANQLIRPSDCVKDQMRKMAMEVDCQFLAFYCYISTNVFRESFIRFNNLKYKAKEDPEICSRFLENKEYLWGIVKKVSPDSDHPDYAGCLARKLADHGLRLLSMMAHVNANRSLICVGIIGDESVTEDRDRSDTIEDPFHDILTNIFDYLSMIEAGPAESDDDDNDGEEETHGG
jgi:hypothetical protein